MIESNLISSKEIARLLSLPERVSEDDLQLLEGLISKFPYCQSFHFAYTMGLKRTDPERYENYLKKAAIYTPRRDVLYSFINTPENLRRYTEKNITEEQQDISVSEVADTPANSVAEAEELLITASLPADTEDDSTDPSYTGQAEQEEPLNYAAAETEILTEVQEISPEEPAGQATQQENENITEEVVTEIPEEQVIEEDPENIAASKLMVGSIASSYYFTFDKSAVDPLQEEELKENITEPVKPVIAVVQRQADDVSRYHDDTLPYTFLWWLHKTRKEYAATYQPYVVKPGNMMPGKPLNTELNQQIIENIFHIQPELNTFDPHTLSNTVNFELKKKEDALIEKFITEEPQIRPPQPNKIDTENKARKSSEDNLDLVSETLARIYTDQMLFHKAIDTYKKLSLKFPEKSTYFAAQIKDLEKRIN